MWLLGQKKWPNYKKNVVNFLVKRKKKSQIQLILIDLSKKSKAWTFNTFHRCWTFICDDFVKSKVNYIHPLVNGKTSRWHEMNQWQQAFFFCFWLVIGRSTQHCTGRGRGDEGQGLTHSPFTFSMHSGGERKKLIQATRLSHTSILQEEAQETETEHVLKALSKASFWGEWVKVRTMMTSPGWMLISSWLRASNGYRAL